MRLWIVLVLAGLIAGCAPGPEPTPPDDEEEAGPAREAKANALLSRGDYAEAAAAFARAAEQAPPAKEAALRLEQGRALALAGQSRKALAPLQGLEGTDQVNKARLLRGRIHLRLGQLDRAHKQLQPLTAPDTPDALREAALDYLAQGQRQADKPTEALDYLVQRHRLLTEGEAREANLARARHILERSPENALESVARATDDPALQGFLRFEIIMRRAQRQPLRQTRQDLEGWLGNFPDHPLSRIVRQRLDRVQEKPLRLALLLPMSSRYRPVADAILHGMLAAYYASDREADIQLAVFDTQGTSEGTQKALAKVEAGDFAGIIGPLTPEGARAVTGKPGEAPAPPTLILNTTRHWAAPGRGLFQFGLNPEQEAAQVATDAHEDGHRQAAVLYPQTDRGRRMVAAFQEQWRDLGGRTAAIEAFDPDERDHTAPLKALLHLDDLENRRTQLAETLGVNLPEYDDPPQRLDADFLFLPAGHTNARLIKPQLDFLGAEDLPILATSRIFEAGAKENDRRDLDPIRFLHIPWLLEGRYEQGAADQLAAAFPDEAASQGQLNALGHDAYRLMVGAWRRSLLLGNSTASIMTDMRLEGGTGRLHMDKEGRIQRRLQWARYRGGRIQHLDAPDGAP